MKVTVVNIFQTCHIINNHFQVTLRSFIIMRSEHSIIDLMNRGSKSAS